MVRSNWMGPVVAVLAVAGSAPAQAVPGQAPGKSTLLPPAPGDRLVMVQEMNKPAQRCRVLKCWKDKSGHRLCQVQALDTGEIMTIEEAGPVTTTPSPGGPRIQASSTRIFHWGRSATAPPRGVPVPPPNAVVVTAPVPPPPPSPPSPPPKRHFFLFASDRTPATPRSTPVCKPSPSTATPTTAKAAKEPGKDKGCVACTRPAPKPTILERLFRPTPPQPVVARTTGTAAKTPASAAQAKPGPATAVVKAPVNAPSPLAAKPTAEPARPVVKAGAEPVKPPVVKPVAEPAVVKAGAKPVGPARPVVKAPEPARPAVKPVEPARPAVAKVVEPAKPPAPKPPEPTKPVVKAAEPAKPVEPAKSVVKAVEPPKPAAQPVERARLGVVKAVEEPVKLPVAKPVEEPAGLPVAKPEVEPAKLTDWRQSWGVVDRWTGEDTEKVKRSAPAPRNLPHAQNDPGDPLTRPEVYTKVNIESSHTPKAAVLKADAPPAGPSEVQLSGTAAGRPDPLPPSSPAPPVPVAPPVMPPVPVSPPAPPAPLPAPAVLPPVPPPPPAPAASAPAVPSVPPVQTAASVPASPVPVPQAQPEVPLGMGSVVAASAPDVPPPPPPAPAPPARRAKKAERPAPPPPPVLAVRGGEGNAFDSVQPAEPAPTLPAPNAWRTGECLANWGCPMIRFACPACQQVFDAPDRGAGRKVSCPSCGQRLQIPNPAARPPRNKTVIGSILTSSSRPEAQAAGPSQAAMPAPPARPPLAYGPMPGPMMPPPGMPAAGYPYPQPVAQPMALDTGTPPGLANAFTRGGTTRPIPADFGPPQHPDNAFIEEARGAMAAPPQAAPALAMRPSPPGPMMPAGYAPAGPQAAYFPPPMPAGVPTAQLAATLRDSLYPSRREWAAEQLGGRDWRVDTQAVQALLTGARSDPAPMVRAECVRALARMKANTAPVVTVVQALKTDADPRVRQEVEQALAVLGTPGVGALPPPDSCLLAPPAAGAP